MPAVIGPAKQIGPEEQRELDAARHQRYLDVKDLIFDTNKGATDTGIMALKSAMILNGGSAIATLAFISQHWTEVTKGEARVAAMGFVLESLVFGTFVAVLATGFGYLRFYEASVYYPKEIDVPGSGTWHLRAAQAYLYAAMLCVIGSYGLFVNAMIHAIDVLF